MYGIYHYVLNERRRAREFATIRNRHGQYPQPKGLGDDAGWDLKLFFPGNGPTGMRFSP